MFKNHSLVMLDTEKPSHIVKNNNVNGLFYGGMAVLASKRLGSCTNQHLYLLSEDSIKESELGEQRNTGYMYNIKDGFIFFTEDMYFYRNYCKQVIATTDESLGLPLIPLSFVEEFISVNGKIGMVKIEYVEYPNKIGATIGEGIIDGFKSYLKTTPTNTINILTH